ncbi:hypothetical protein [Notoacmeibacter sp. MSK16QG-6]|uniref:hypothetical protein n=1 Tax=Notoacmeibacter sp. MSK16QG-6 TaxID=2957982 RepID=UPI0020A1BBB1|nr:hypothetical protein [Notoacmeibacter sp. MSK16QG-6]MCP1200178.1 hypothetical protein [Notoacmeibacter sp. MSK16QG-6]
MAKARIYKVVDVAISTPSEKTDHTIIQASGFPATSGWRDIKLRPLEDELSADSILDLEFVGTPPDDPALQVIPQFPVSATFQWDGADGKLVGVRIVSRSNELTRLMRPLQRSARMSVMPQPGGAGDADTLPPITFEEGEEAPTLGEDYPTDPKEDLPTLDEGEEPPTFGEDQPTFREEGPSYGIEEIPTASEDGPTFFEDPPTFGEEAPTFREQDPTQWENLPTIFPGETDKHWITDNPPGPLPPTTTYWETHPQPPYPWPGPFNPGPFEPTNPQNAKGRWVYRNGRWYWVATAQKGKTPFGRR